MRKFYLFHPSDTHPVNEVRADSVREVRTLLRQFYSDADDWRIRLTPDPISW